MTSPGSRKVSGINSSVDHKIVTEVFVRSFTLETAKELDFEAIILLILSIVEYRRICITRHNTIEIGDIFEEQTSRRAEFITVICYGLKLYGIYLSRYSKSSQILA